MLNANESYFLLLPFNYNLNIPSLAKSRRDNVLELCSHEYIN